MTIAVMDADRTIVGSVGIIPGFCRLHIFPSPPLSATPLICSEVTAKVLVPLRCSPKLVRIPNLTPADRDHWETEGGWWRAAGSESEIGMFERCSSPCNGSSAVLILSGNLQVTLVGLKLWGLRGCHQFALRLQLRYTKLFRIDHA